MDRVNGPQFGSSYSTQGDRLKELARRSALAVLVLADDSGKFIFFDLQAGHIVDELLFVPLLRAGYRVAGVLGYSERGIECEAEDGCEDLMRRARESFALDVVTRLNSGGLKPCFTSITQQCCERLES